MGRLLWGHPYVEGKHALGFYAAITQACMEYASAGVRKYRVLNRD